jgi:hypothetical protein
MSPLRPFACQMGFYVLTAALKSGWPVSFPWYPVQPPASYAMYGASRRVVMGPETHEECMHNQCTAIWQPTFCMQYSPKFAQQACNPDPRSLVGSRDPGPALQRAVCRGPSHWPAGYYELPVIISLRAIAA